MSQLTTHNTMALLNHELNELDDAFTLMHFMLNQPSQLPKLGHIRVFEETRENALSVISNLLLSFQREDILESRYFDSLRTWLSKSASAEQLTRVATRHFNPIDLGVPVNLLNRPIAEEVPPPMTALDMATTILNWPNPYQANHSAL